MRQQRDTVTGGEIARIVVAVLIVVLALTQGPVIQALVPLDVTPNLVFVFVFLWSGYHGVREGFVWAFAAGLLLDLLLFAPLGSHAFALMIVVLAIEPVRRWVFGENVAWVFLAVFVGGLLFDAMYLVVGRAAGASGGIATLWRFSVARALTDALATVVLLPLVLALRRWGGHANPA